MKKHKKLAVLIIIAIVVMFILILLLRTPSPIIKMNNMDVSGITVSKINYNSEIVREKESEFDNYIVLEKESIDEFVDLITDAKFKYNYDMAENISWSGDAVTYLCYVEMPNDRVKLEILVVDNGMSVSLDKKSVSFGLFGTMKYNVEKEVFLKQLNDIIEPHFVKK